jgi:hypothetical protein
MIHFNYADSIMLSLVFDDHWKAPILDLDYVK